MAKASTTERGLSEGRVLAYVRGELPPDEHAEVEAALDQEPEWLAVVAVLARDGADRASAVAKRAQSQAEDLSEVAQIQRAHELRLHPGSRVGRYEVETTLGRGGMGVVFAAYDPQLHRRVALKVLRSREARGQARLLREARALGRLNHRNVITIYDVGTVDDRVFLTMELLDGETLGAWCAARQRTWREIASVFVDAGRGLAAAHACGLVHRDFKPSNVMITPDGRVVVLDFGLAHGFGERGATSQTGCEQERPPSRVSTGSLGDGIAGTPAYMAPEQRRGERCGPAADQFSFCVALHEALHGELPSTVPLAGTRLDRVEAQGRPPGRVDRVIARGASLDVRDRYPDMESLIDALEAVLRPHRRRSLLAIGLAPLVVAGLWSAHADVSEPCTGGERAMASTWNASRAATVRMALERAGRPWSERVRDEVDRRLDAYATAWIAEHEATCRATRIESVQSEEELDLRMHCLDRRRRSLEALVEVLAVADVETASRAVQAVEALEPVAGCRDLEALRAPVPLPAEPRARAQAEAAFDRIARVDALREAARHAEATALASRVVADAVALAHAPTEAAARLALGWVHMELGAYEAAETELRAALHAAEHGGDDEAVTLAWNRLGWVVGYKLARHEEGRRIAEHARAWSRRLERRSLHELSRLRTLGWIEHEAGSPRVAREHFERALALAEQLPTEDPVSSTELALVFNGLGAAALALGDTGGAEESFAQAGDRLEARLGPEHPDVARVRNNLASMLRERGKGQEARALFEHNVRVFQETFGDAHPLVGQTLVNLAVVDLDLGRYAVAEQGAQRACEVLEAAHGPGHPLTAKAHTIRGDARIQLGRPEEAILDFVHALEIERRTLGSEHPSVGIVHSNLGAAYFELGRFADAAEHQRRALEILEASLGAEHPNVAFVLMSLGLTRRRQERIDEALELFRRAHTLGPPTVRPNALTRIAEILLDRGELDAAIEQLDQARAFQDQLETNPAFVGDTMLALARARWASGDREAAYAEARAAVQAYRRAGDTEAEAQARHWLLDHAGALE